MAHRFEVEPELAPREARYTRADLVSMGKNQLIDTFLDLQDRADQFLSCIEDMLRANHTQAELLTSIELHLDIPPQLTESHHQNVALDHALTWIEVYGNDSDLLMNTSKIQTPVTTRRLKAIRDHIRDSGSGGSSLTSTSESSSTGLPLAPLTLCKHVLSTDVKHIPRHSFTIGYNDPERPQNMLTFKQIALGMSIREFIDSFAEDCPEKDDNEVWRRMESPLLHAIDTPEMSASAWNRLCFVGAWFRSLRSGHFEAERLRFLMEMQREAREKVANERAVPMICTQCREEKVEGNEVATRLVQAQGRLLEWWKGSKEEVDTVVEGILQRFRVEDRNEARRAYEEFARNMNTFEDNGAHATCPGSIFSSSSSSDEGEVRVPREAAQESHAHAQQQGPEYPAPMPPDDLGFPGRYQPEFQPNEINRLVRHAHSRSL